MKTKLGIIIFLLAATLAHAQTNNLTALLQQGLFEEQANRNLDAAIEDYQALARQFDKDRQLAATAVFRLGECYRMQGKTNEAALEYQRILRDFSDQTTLAMLSRQNLTGMGMTPVPAASAALQTQKDLLAKQIALAEQDLADTQRLFQTGVVLQDKVRTAEREVLRLKQQLAALDSNYAGSLSQTMASGNSDAKLWDQVKSLPLDQLEIVLPALARDAALTLLLQRRDGAAANLVDMQVNGFSSTNPLFLKQKLYLDTFNKQISSRLDGILAGLKMRAELSQTSAASGAPAANASDAALWNKARDLSPDQLEKVLPTLVPDAGLTQLLQQRADAETKLAELNVDYSTNHPSYQKQLAVLKTINQQIEGKIAGIMQALKMRAELSQTSVATSLPTDEEAREIARIQTMIRNSPDLINARVPGGEGTPLQKAAAAGWIKVATYLLDHGADVNADRGGALYAAAKAGNRAMVELLLSRGADVNPREITGQTPLHVAVQNGFQAVVGVLLANKADVNAQNGSGVTPLFLAAGRDNLKIVSLLLEHKADVNAFDQAGATPLINAAHSGHPEIVKLLLAAGANPNVETSSSEKNGPRQLPTSFYGRTALSFAAESGSPEMIRMLLAAKAEPNGGKLNAPLLCAIYNNNIESAELLLKAGAKPDSIGEFNFSRQPGSSGGFGGGGGLVSGRGGRGGFGGTPRSVTPLWLAISENQLPMVQLLLKFKADPNDSQTDGSPVIFDALPHLDILAALLDAGADPNRPNKHVPNNPNPVWQGESPLMSAVGNSFYETPEGNLTAAKLLLAHGANPNAKDRDGDTALHWAVGLGGLEGWTIGPAKRELVQLLLGHHLEPNMRNDDGKTPLDLLKDKIAQSSFRAYSPETVAKQKAFANELAALLRQHGALDVLPDWDRITVSRPSAKYSEVIFYRGTNDWNRFTLLDAILNCYQSSHSFSGGLITPTGMSQIMQFPDLTRVTILRHTHGSTNETRIPVNLLNSTNGVDCSKDVPLEFGDVVEIPERNHALGDQPVGLTASEAKSITDYLKGSVLLETHGQKVELSIYPSATGSELGSVVRQEEAQKVLLSSSDLSRVKVIRRDAKTGRTREWIVDCSPPQSPSNGSTVFSSQLTFGADSQPMSDLWLRDGDVIEVPGKP